MSDVFVPLVEPPDEGAPGLWFCVRDGAVLVEVGEVGVELPRWGGPDEPARRGLAPEAVHFLGTLGGVPCWSAAADADCAEPAGMAFRPLRSLYGLVPERLWVLAGRAVQIVEWDRTHRFCGRCGARTERAPGERARRCPACHLLAFPRLAPAVIVLVERGDEVLLAHNSRFAAPMYSTIAGFVEPGETLEEAVRREVAEEVGVRVDGLRYFGSQPWPFPHSLMIGFVAEWAGGEIEVDGDEIDDARWFRPDDLPMVPPRMSIARSLIDDFVARRAGR